MNLHGDTIFSGETRRSIRILPSTVIWQEISLRGKDFESANSVDNIASAIWDIVFPALERNIKKLYPYTYFFLKLGGIEPYLWRYK